MGYADFSSGFSQKLEISSDGFYNATIVVNHNGEKGEISNLLYGNNTKWLLNGEASFGRDNGIWSIKRNSLNPKIKDYLKDSGTTILRYGDGTNADYFYWGWSILPLEKRLKDKAANATINRELAALKRMFNIGAKQTPPVVDRVPYIPLLKENNARQGFFEHGEFLALRGALPSYLKGFVSFGYKVGWRVSEIAGLTWNQVDRNQGIVRLEVGETKNDAARTVYLDDEPYSCIDNMTK